MFYRVRKEWSQPETQIGAFTVLQNAKNMVDLNPGYAAFDEEGKIKYPPQCDVEEERSEAKC